MMLCHTIIVPTSHPGESRPQLCGVQLQVDLRQPSALPEVRTAPAVNPARLHCPQHRRGRARPLELNPDVPVPTPNVGLFVNRLQRRPSSAGVAVTAVRVEVFYSDSGLVSPGLAPRDLEPADVWVSWQGAPVVTSDESAARGGSSGARDGV